MPTLQELRTSIPELTGLDDSTAVEYIRRIHYPDRTAAEIGSRLGVKPAAPSVKPRSIPAAVNDTVIDFSNAVAGGVASIGNFVSPGNRVSKFIQDDIIQAGRANQSDATQAEDARYGQEMEAAQGIGDEVASTLGYVARNPIRSLATAAGSFVGPAAGVKAAQLAARGVGVSAGGVGAARAGMAGGALTGAALAGGDAGGTAYDLVIKAGGTPEQATEAARNASVIPAAVGGVGGMVGAERLLAGAKGFSGGRLAQIGKTAAVEGGQEFIEEGVTQYEGRRAAMPYDPTIDPMKGVAGAATMGAVLGAATGGAMAALKPQVPELGPLSRAANIAPDTTPEPPPPPVPLTPEQDATLKAHANARNAELTEKAKGTKDVKTPEGTIPGKQPEFLTPAEKEEQAFLQQNGGDTQALAKAYPGLTAEQEQRALANIQDFANEGQDRMRTFAPAPQPAPPRQPATVIRAEPEPRPQPPSFEPDLTTPAAIYESLNEIEQRNDQTRRMYAQQPGDRLNKQGKPFSNKAAAKIDQKKAGDGFAIVPADNGFVVRPVVGVSAEIPQMDADLPTLKKAWSDAAAAGRTEDAKVINDRILALKAPKNAPERQAPAQAEGTQAPAPAAVAGAAAPEADFSATGQPAVQAGGVDQKARWLKNVADSNRLAGPTGAQITGIENGRLNYAGDPRTSKQGKSLIASVDEALKAGATLAEIAQAAAPKPTSTNAAAPKVQPPAQVAGDRVAAAPRQGQVGDKFAAGEVALTASGRTTTPFPKVALDTNRKAAATIKAVDQWLMSNALAEAESRGDDFNARQFRANQTKPQQADKDSAEEYLFGDQPRVLPSITRPLISTAAAPPPQAQPAATAVARPNRRTKAVEAKAKEAESKRADYFSPGNIVKSFGGHDEVLSYTPTAGGGFTVKVHEVKKNDQGEWVRLGKPQDARQHATNPDARELAAGPVARLNPQPGAEVKYSEPRADGAPFQNAPGRGRAPVQDQANPAAPEPAPKTLKERREQAKATPGRNGPNVIINRLGPDGLTDAERAAGKKPYNDPPAPPADDKTVKSLFGNAPLKGASGKMDTLGGFSAGDRVKVSGRTIGDSTVEFLFTRDMAGFSEPGQMAQIVNADGKRLQVLTSELQRIDAAPDLQTSVAVRELAARAAALQTPPAAAPAPSANTVFTEDAAAAARARLKAKLGRLSSGIDPETMMDGITLAGYHVEKGARTFAAYARAMVDDLGDAVKPYLQSWYMALRADPKAAAFKADMDKASAIEDLTPPQIEALLAPNDANQTAQKAQNEAPKENPDDSPTSGSAPAVNQPLAQRPEPSTARRGAQQPRKRAGRADDRVVRGTGGLVESAADEGAPLGDGGKPDTVPAGADGTVAGGVQRVPTRDFRPAAGDLKREGSWFATAARNIDLIELALRIQAEKRVATPQEQAQLAKYVGFGASEIRNNLFPVPSQWARQQDPKRLIWPDLVREARWKPLAERMAALPEEWQRSVLQSTQYAHYTSEGVIRSVWSGLQRLGFTGGKVLEPGMGIGSFNMLMPDTVHATSRYTGVEFDGPTALIAQMLSPDQNMLHEDFIKRKFPRDFFDLAVGNPPFSQTKILGDPDYEKFGFMLHDFFFAKSLDRVRPGGLLVFVTSKGTMDKQSDKARKYLAERADLLGAIRLPSTAFEDNAGTSVVTDVLFLRKRAPGQEPAGPAWTGVQTIDTKDGPVVVNEYFAANPGMVLGEQRINGNVDDFGRRINSNGMGGAKYTVVSYDSTPEQLDERFAKAIESLPENVYSPLSANSEQVKRETAKVDFDPSIKREGVVYLGADGKLRRVQSGVGVALADGMKLSAKDEAWFKGYVGVRDMVQAARLAQVQDGDWEKALKALNKAYDAFRKEHGPINDFRTQTRRGTDEEGNEVTTEIRIFKNRRLFREDYDSAVMTQLEVINETGEIIKAPFLLGRTIGKPVVREVKTVGDALAVSLDETGRLDLDDIARRMSLRRDEVVDALGTQIYKAPGGQWQLSDEYLSGDVVAKLEEAELAARLDPSLARNVQALKEVQPEKLGPSQISVKAGASWVPAEYVNDFAKEIGAGAVTFDSKTESWQVQGGNERSARRAGAEYGTADRSPSELLESVLNSQSITIKRTDADKKVYTDAAATTAANEMARKIKEKFKGWVWTDADRASNLVEIYNKRFNNIAPRRFDGSHMTLPGVSLRFSLHPHQKRAIWRQVQTGDTYLAHAVGAGKTIEMIAGGMEQKRLGLISKPMYAVPNHMLEQFANEFMELYPLANIMVADDENFSAERRKAFVAAATLNAPDAIVITHSAFERIGVKEETVAPIRDEILDDLQTELEDSDKGDRVRRAQLQQQIEAVEQRFDSIVGAGKKDSTIKFEDIGADFVYVDEAHAFRKLDFTTNQKIKGIDPNGSRRALDMYVKTRYLGRKKPGRAMVFASGTPVTNTMGELYTIMRFFSPQELSRGGIATFDAWARQFGEAVPALEANAAGRYEVVERFAKFDNVPELMSRVRQFMDVLTSEHLGALVKRPDIEGGKPDLITVDPTEALKKYMKGVLLPRLEQSRKWKPTKDQPFNPDPVIAITSDGRFAALDPRFVGEKIDENATPTKLTRMADEVAQIYKASAGNEYLDKQGKPEPVKGSTQIVFYNLGFGAQSMQNRGFDARGTLTKRLVAQGVKRDHILWFDDADTDSKKETMFKAMRNGQARVLIGSAKKMGTGVNVQKRLLALHYFDPPWYPSDVEQPHGRIIRQGNQNTLATIKWYATKGTYDSTMWQMVARKQRFIDQAFSGDKSLRTMEDMSEASMFEQAAAVASGDPRALQLAGLRQDVERLERLQAAHASEQIALRSGLRSAEWNIESYAKRVKTYGDAFKAIGGGYYSFSSATVGGKTFDKVGEFGQALKDAFNQKAADAVMEPGTKTRALATLPSGITVRMEANEDREGKPTGEHELVLRAGSVDIQLTGYAAALGEKVDAVGLGRRVINAVNGIEADLNRAKSSLANEETDATRLRKKLGAPFEYQQELAEKIGDLKRLEEELRAEGEAEARAAAAEVVIDATGASEAGQPRADGAAQFSRATGQSTTPAQLRTALETEFSPETIGALERAGLLTIGDRPTAGMPSDAAGVSQGGRIGLFAGNTRPGSTAVAYHEALHATLKTSIGEQTYAALLDRLAAIDSKAMAGGATQKFFAQARGRIPADLTGTERLEELAAYSVEAVQAEREGTPLAIKRWVSDFLAALRAGLSKALQAAGVGLRIRARLLADPATLRKIARDGLQAMARQGMQGDAAMAFSQPAAGPKWYSALKQSIAGLSMGAAPAQGWKDSIKGLVAKGAVKADEIEWTGINEFLDLQQGKVTKAQVMAFMDANGVQVTETVLSDEVARSLPAGWQVLRGYDDTFTVSDGDGNIMGEGETAAEAVANAQDEDAAADTPSMTKYGRYTLPGGTNYREVLLTLPTKSSGKYWAEDVGTVPGVQNWMVASTRESDGETVYRGKSHGSRQSAERAIAELEGAKNYKSSHWDQPNVLAHIRLNDRTDADGNRVLFVEEAQSDWGQDGKKKGFANPSMKPLTNKEYQAYLDGLVDEYADKFAKEAGSRRDAERNAINMPMRALAEALGKADELATMRARRQMDIDGVAAVPLAPFVGATDKWLTLALKRVIKMAVDGSYDKVAFVTGEQSADRYDLSKQVDSIRITRVGADEFDVAAAVKGGGRGISETGLSLARLEETVGKELAKRGAALPEGVGETYTDTDLKVGGEGMKAFYDQIVPAATKALLKKLGGGQMEAVPIAAVEQGLRVKPVDSPFGKFVLVDGSGKEVGLFETEAEAKAYIRQAAKPQPGFAITPQMREKASGGMPLFSRTDQTATEAFKRWLSASLAFDGRPDAFAAEHGGDSLASDAAFVRNFFDTRTVQEFGLGGFDIPSRRVVMRRVLGVLEDFKIRQSVVQLIPVDVVNILGAKQLTPKMLFNDMAMLTDLLAGNRNDSIPLAVDETAKVADAVAAVTAEHLAANPKLGRSSGNDGAALGAGHRDAAALRQSGAGVLAVDIPAGRNGRREPENGRGALSARVETFHDRQRIKHAIAYNAESGTSTIKTFNPASPDIRFSRTMGETLREAVPSAAQEWIADRATSQRGFNRPWHRTVGTQLHKAKINKDFGRVYYAAQDFMKDVSRIATLASDRAPDMLPQIETLSDMAKLAPSLASPAAYKQRKADIKGASDALFDGTLRYTRNDDGEAVAVDPDSNELGGLVWTDAELRDRGMSERAIKMYRQSREAIDQSLDSMLAADLFRQAGVLKPEMLADTPSAHQALLDGMRKAAASDNPAQVGQMLREAIRGQLESLGTALEGQPNQYTDGLKQRQQELRDLQVAIGEKIERIGSLKASGYAPLMRFGPYAVDVIDADGQRIFFGLYEGQAAANQAARNFRGQGLQVSQSVMPQSDFEALKGVSPETAMLFAEMLGVEKNEAMQTWLKNAVAEQSALKRHIRRKGIEGFDEDGSRVLAAFVTSNARAASRALHATRMADAVENVRQGDVKDEARALVEYINNPKEEAQAIRSLLFVQYIGGSVASALVNLTQTLVQTLPYLSQYGGAVKAGQRLSGAMKLALADKITDTELSDAVKRAEKDGVIKPQEVFQLQAEASRSLGSNLYVRSLLSAWGSMFQMAEVFNRRVAFIGAYNTAKEQGIADPFAFAENAVDETQSVFNKGNRPNWSRGAVGATLFTFKTFTIQYVEFLKRLSTAGEPGSPERKQGQRAAAVALMMLMILSGMKGIPFADDAEDLVDTVAQALGYNWVTDAQRDRWLDKMLGETMSDIVQHGLSGVPGVPFDVSQRLGMANLLPGTGLLKQSETNKQNQVLEVFGVAGSAVKDATQGQVLPLAIRNLMKGLDTYQTGMYRDSRGRNVVESDGLGAALKAIGLQPSRVASAQRDIGRQIEERNLYSAVKEEITDAMAQARFDKDANAAKQAAAALNKWNDTNPEAPIIIKSHTIQARVRQMMRSKAERTIANAPRPLRAATAEALQ
jgi:N12 class adenine-specific DNA methylase